MKKKYIQLLVGILLLFLFTQIRWADFLFKKNNNEVREMDNTALFYTESEEATKVEFYMRKK
ncbi:MAG: hypothetical protein AAF573_14540 [Bacteroidota bacterium]